MKSSGRPVILIILVLLGLSTAAVVAVSVLKQFTGTAASGSNIRKIPASHILSVTQPVYTVTGVIASLSGSKAILRVTGTGGEVPIILDDNTRYARMFDLRLNSLLGSQKTTAPRTALRSDLREGMNVTVTTATDIRLAGELPASYIELPATIQSITARVSDGSGRSFRISVPDSQSGEMSTYVVELRPETRVLLPKRGVSPGINPLEVQLNYDTGSVTDVRTGSWVELIYEGERESTIRPRVVIVTVPGSQLNPSQVNGNAPLPATQSATASPVEPIITIPAAVPTGSGVSSSDATTPDPAGR